MRSAGFIIFLLLFIVLIIGSSAFIISTVRQVIPPTSILYHHIWIPFALFPMLLIGIMLLGNVSYIPELTFLYTLSSLWLPFLLYSFIAAILLKIYILFRLEVSGLSTALFALVLATVLIGVMAYGIWKATTYKIITYTVEAPALRQQWADKKIVLFSDSHIGWVRSDGFMRQIVATINGLKPDIVFVAGDLIDGPIIPFEQDLQSLQNLESTYGTYYAAGNHDEYNREQLQYQEELEKAGIVILNDKKALVNNTQIIGIQFEAETYESTKNRLATTGFDRNVPSIAIMHDPRNTQALAESGVSLSLSGHTHGGQFWPFSILITSMYKDLARGVAYLEDHAHITTVGVGTWGPLFRLGTQPEIVIIEIK